MSDFWISTIIVGLVTTFIFRGGFIIFGTTKPFPKIIEEFLDYIPVAAMFAIASAHILFTQTEQSLEFSLIEIIAGAIALISAWLSKNLFITLSVGMSALWIVQYFIA